MVATIALTGKKIRLSSYSAIISNGAVKPGNYQGSELYKVLVAIGGTRYATFTK
ncbi:MAG: hypothetical protein R2769_05935 [Saprospiraceae bacterium]